MTDRKAEESRMEIEHFVIREEAGKATEWEWGVGAGREQGLVSGKWRG